MLRDQVAQSQPPIQFADEDEAAIGGDPRVLELDPQRGVERQLKGLVLRPPPGMHLPQVIIVRKPASINTFDAPQRFPAHSQIGNPGLVVGLYIFPISANMEMSFDEAGVE